MHTFKLQPVLDHRQFVEDALKKELAAIKQLASTAREQLNVLERKERDTAETMRQEQVQGLPSDQAAGYHAYLGRLSERIAAQRSVIAEIASRESRKQAELRDAMKNRQMLEKLRDKDRDRYHRAMLKQEMNFIDEIAVNQFARKTHTGPGDDG